MIINSRKARRRWGGTALFSAGAAAQQRQKEEQSCCLGRMGERNYKYISKWLTAGCIMSCSRSDIQWRSPRSDGAALYAPSRNVRDDATQFGAGPCFFWTHGRININIHDRYKCLFKYVSSRRGGRDPSAGYGSPLPAAVERKPPENLFRFHVFSR